MKKEKGKQPSFHLGSVYVDVSLSLISIVTVFLATAVTVFAVLWILSRSSVISLPDTWKVLFGLEASQTDAEPDETSIYDCLRENSRNRTEEAVTVYTFSGNFSTLRALLAEQAALPCHAVYKTKLFTAQSAQEATVTFIRAADAFTMKRTVDGNTETWDIRNAEKTVLYQATDGSSAEFPLSDAFSPEALCGIPDIHAVLNLDDAQTEYISYAYLDGDLVYYIRFRDNTDSFVGEYWVAPEKGLVILAKSYASDTVDDEKTVFTATMTAYTKEVSAEE